MVRVGCLASASWLHLGAEVRQTVSAAVWVETRGDDGPTGHRTLRGEQTHGDGRGVTVRQL